MKSKETVLANTMLLGRFKELRVHLRYLQPRVAIEFILAETFKDLYTKGVGAICHYYCFLITTATEVGKTLQRQTTLNIWETIATCSEKKSTQQNLVAYKQPNGVNATENRITVWAQVTPHR